MSIPQDATPAQRAVLDRLKADGPSHAADVAHTLGISTMAVRQHLQALLDLGLVELAETEHAGLRGRPSRRWRLRTQADRYFPDAHADLTLDLIAGIRAVFGERGLEKLIDKRTEIQGAEYRRALAGAATLREKIRRLARLRTEAGYMASFEAIPDGFRLVENHCPVCRAARACAGLCRQELEAFQAALGPDVVITRTDHILAGARRCAYTIRRK